MTLFLQRVEKRKNILDLSVLFHTHVVEVSSNHDLNLNKLI
jgi:hypothetical protein